jgi:nitrogen-specific signal transduction histidine kinase
MNFCEKWIEYDYNPHFLFDQNGKILSLNNEAQHLLGYADSAQLFKLAITYANANTGFKTSFIDLEFGRFRFFALMVGYDNEEEIGLRLFQSPVFHYSKPKIEGEIVNIYALIDLCISSNSIGKSTNFLLDLDPTIPNIRLRTDRFIKLLNRIYSMHAEAETVTTKLYFRVGEYIKTEEKKFTLFSIEVTSEAAKNNKSSEIRLLAEEMNIFVDFKAETTVLNIPLIQE